MIGAGVDAPAVENGDGDDDDVLCFAHVRGPAVVKGDGEGDGEQVLTVVGLRGGKDGAPQVRFYVR